jgi:hypothetical protein
MYCINGTYHALPTSAHPRTPQHTFIHVSRRRVRCHKSYQVNGQVRDTLHAHTLSHTYLDEEEMVFTSPASNMEFTSPESNMPLFVGRGTRGAEVRVDLITFLDQV